MAPITLQELHDNSMPDLGDDGCQTVWVIHNFSGEPHNALPAPSGLFLCNVPGTELLRAVGAA